MIGSFPVHAGNMVEILVAGYSIETLILTP
jgi:hypothetical protein